MKIPLTVVALAFILVGFGCRGENPGQNPSQNKIPTQTQTSTPLPEQTPEAFRTFLEDLPKPGCAPFEHYLKDEGIWTSVAENVLRIEAPESDSASKISCEFGKFVTLAGYDVYVIFDMAESETSVMGTMAFWQYSIGEDGAWIWMDVNEHMTADVDFSVLAGRLDVIPHIGTDRIVYEDIVTGEAVLTLVWNGTGFVNENIE